MYSQLFDELNKKKPNGVFFMPFSSVHYEAMNITQQDLVAQSQYLNIGERLEWQSEVGNKPYTLTKYSKRFIDIVPISLALHRLQITVRIRDKRAVSWARFLGFTEEGILRGYGPDKANYYMMRK